MLSHMTDHMIKIHVHVMHCKNLMPNQNFKGKSKNCKKLISHMIDHMISHTGHMTNIITSA